MRRVRVLGAVALLLALGAARGSGAAASDEDALRRRVERFYVLSYLNRYGEMWEIFTPELKRRLGGDKKEYIRTSRQAGFELYSSRIESVSVLGASATVDVAIQAQLPGQVDASWRRHRMAWRSDAAEGWLYAGSLDITAQESSTEGQELLPVPKAPAAVDAPDEKLPLRERVVPPAPAAETAPAETAPPAARAPAPAPRAAPGGERWDLVAVPPPGATAPRGVEAAPQAPAPSAQAPAPAPPAMLPPERTADAAPKPAPSSRLAADEEPIETLVRRAKEASGLRRLRALDKIRDSHDRRLVPLIAQAMPEAPTSAAIVFLDKLALLGDASHAHLAVPRLGADEPELRRAAFHALAELGGPGQIAAVADALAAETAVMPRIAGLRALGALGKGDARAGMLVAQVVGDTRASDAEREAAARAAGAARFAEAEPALLRILGEERPPLAYAAAIGAAGSLATPACVKALEGLVERGGVVETPTARPVALLAARALVAAEAPRAGAVLSRVMLLFDRDAQVVDADAVAESGDAPALVALLAHSSALVRMRAAELLGRAVESPEDAARVLPALDRALMDSNDPNVLVAIQRARERLTALAGTR